MPEVQEQGVQSGDLAFRPSTLVIVSEKIGCTS